MLFIFLQRLLVPIVFIVSSFIFTGCAKQSIEEKKINVVFRFDDPSALSSTETEVKILNAFRKYHAQITFGVVPFICSGIAESISPCNDIPLGPKKARIFKDAAQEGILDIALHGYSHQTIYSNYHTEFAGLDYDSQFAKLKKGKKHLEQVIGITPTTFIPPWNQYDANTLKALEVLGFTTISAAISKKAPHNSILSFLPFTTELPEIRDALQEARASSDLQPLIVVLFHAYDFKEADSQKGIISFDDLNEILGWLKSQNDVRILSISQANKEITNLSANRFQAAKENFSLEVLLPPFLQDQRYLYQESPHLMNTVLKIILLHLLIIFLGIVLFYIILCLFFSKSVKIMKISMYGNIILSAIIILYAIHDLYLHFKETAIIAVFIGTSIGSWICFHKEKEKSE